MQYPKSEIINDAAREVEGISNSLRIAVLALEVERDSMTQSLSDFDSDLQAILGLGVLLNDLQTQRGRAMRLTKVLPSPNQVVPALREKTAAVGVQLFEALEQIRHIQREVYRMARLNLKSAAHKFKNSPAFAATSLRNKAAANTN